MAYVPFKQASQAKPSASGGYVPYNEEKVSKPKPTTPRLLSDFFAPLPKLDIPPDLKYGDVFSGKDKQQYRVTPGPLSRIGGADLTTPSLVTKTSTAPAKAPGGYKRFSEAAGQAAEQFAGGEFKIRMPFTKPSEKLDFTARGAIPALAVGIYARVPEALVRTYYQAKKNFLGKGDLPIDASRVEAGEEGTTAIQDTSGERYAKKLEEYNKQTTWKGDSATSPYGHDFRKGVTNGLKAVASTLVPDAFDAWIAGDVFNVSLRAFLSKSGYAPMLGIKSRALEGLSVAEAREVITRRATQEAERIIEQNTVNGRLSKTGVDKLNALGREVSQFGGAVKEGTVPSLNRFGQIIEDAAVTLTEDISRVGKREYVPFAQRPIKPPEQELPGYRARPGQPAPVGLSVEEIEPVGFGKKRADLTPQQRGMADDAQKYAREQGAKITPEGNIVLYHGTDATRAPKVGETLRVGTYFTTNEATALQFANQGEGKNPIVLKIEVPAYKVFAGKGEGSYWTLNEETPFKAESEKIEASAIPEQLPKNEKPLEKGFDLPRRATVPPFRAPSQETAGSLSGRVANQKPLPPIQNNTPAPSGKDSFSGFSFPASPKTEPFVSEVDRIKSGNVKDPVTDSSTIGKISDVWDTKQKNIAITLNYKDAEEIVKKHGSFSSQNIVSTANDYDVGVFQKGIGVGKNKINLIKIAPDGFFVLGANRYNGFGVVTFFEKFGSSPKDKKYLETLLSRGTPFSSGGAAYPSSSLQTFLKSEAVNSRAFLLSEEDAKTLAKQDEVVKKPVEKPASKTEEKPPQTIDLFSSDVVPPRNPVPPSESLPSEIKSAIAKTEETSLEEMAAGSLNYAPKPVSKEIFGARTIDSVAEAIKAKELTLEEIDQLRINLVIIEETIADHPGKKFLRYASDKKTGQLPEFTGKDTMRSLSGSGKEVKTSEWARRGDEITQEILGSGRTYRDAPSIEDAQAAINEYKGIKERIDDLKERLRPLREKAAASRFGEKIIKILRTQRRAAVRALKARYGLTENELKELRRDTGDLLLMSDSSFAEFMEKAESLAAEMEVLRQARIQLEATLNILELRKWENMQKALKLPDVSKMTAAQMDQLNAALAPYEKGDEFLTVRQLETADRTEFTGLRTIREVQQFLAKKSEKPYPQAIQEIQNLAKNGLGKFRVLGKSNADWPYFSYDTELARQNPFFELLVQKYNLAHLEGTGNTLAYKEEATKLARKARNSRARTIWDKLVPTDILNKQWLENPADRSQIEKVMTPEEHAWAKYQDSVYKKYYAYLLEQAAMGQKFGSRFAGKYYPHVRRGILEAMKSEGPVAAFKELFDQHAQLEKYFTILDKKTGEVLPYEKWVGFKQFRKDMLVPTEDSLVAFTRYIAAMEKAKQLDKFIPEIMIMVHALTPTGKTARGLSMNNSLETFVKTWINSKKGRVQNLVFSPGGLPDWALRTGIALTRVLDLGLSITGLAAPFGEQAATLSMLGLRKHTLGVSRFATAKGRAIADKYPEFTGENFVKNLLDSDQTLGNRFLRGIFGLFSTATQKSNKVFLLASMTPEEYASGVISRERLAKLRTEMGEYRAIEGQESIRGKSEVGAAFKQYKSWAIPPLISTIRNIAKLKNLFKTQGVEAALKSKATQQLLYSVVLGAVVGIAGYEYYTGLGKKKNRNFIEELTYKAMRDALSMVGILDPSFWTSPARIASFVDDLGTALKQTIMFEEYANGELKGVAGFERALTPRAVKQFVGTEKKKSSGPAIPGLPKLPKLNLPKVKLPKIPSLPKI